MDNQKKQWFQRPRWIKSGLPVKMILVIVFLGLNAVGNLLTAFIQLGTQNIQGFVIYLVTGALYAGPAYGLYHIKRWASFLQLVLSIMFMLQGGFLMLSGYLLLGMINVVLYGLTAIYLLSDESRNLFKKPTS